MKLIKVCAKCADGFSAVFEVNGKVVGEVEQVYVPKFFPGEHYGDYVQLDIDIETGRIVNWKKPTQAQLKETFKF